MNKTVFFILVFLVAYLTDGISQKKRDREMRADTIAVDSLEYELIITDLGFESWLATKPSMNFYSNEYYSQKNRQYVSEWNSRYHSSRRKVLFENYIDYRPSIDYGLEINYKLYYYFRYFEEVNKIKLIPGMR